MDVRRAARALLIPVLLVALTSGCALQDRWAWKLADLDRNRLNLALFRGAETGADLAEWVEHGEVQEAVGTVGRDDRGDLQLIARYERAATDWFGSRTGTESVCYRFTSPDRHAVAFSRTRCLGVAGG